MKALYLHIILILSALELNAQVSWLPEVPRKSDFYGGWGWNRASYTTSDIRFTGEGYDFTLNDVRAKDRQTPFKAEVYFGPTTVTIPQTNFRFGYFLNDHWTLSFGVDHMKYVMQAYQTVEFSGNINDSSYNYLIEGNSIQLDPSFLIYEHTDGLNYINVEAEYFQPLFSYKKFAINGYSGAGLGAMLPKTNVTLMKFPRHDEFHLSGYGLSAKAGIEFLFWKYFFIRFDYKTGFIHMPDILTRDGDVTDRASQHFFFAQRMGMFGFNAPIKKKDSNKKTAE
ncbi:MAG: hypothetical protein RLZZ262_386 [Bacteroidota bacterium]